MKITAVMIFAVLISSAEARPKIKHTWEPVDDWKIFLIDGDKGQMCSIVKPLSVGSLSIFMTGNSTHIYLNYGHRSMPIPHNLSISVDGNHLLDAPILASDTNGAGYYLMADLTGSIFADELAPALVEANTMQLDVGEYRFTVGVGDFSKVVDQIKECAGMAMH